MFREVESRLLVINRGMEQKITALKVQKRNRQRVSVYLNGEYAFGLARIVAAWLQVGQTLDEEKIAQLKAEDSQEVAYQRALKYIGYRMRTESEVRDKITGLGFSDSQTDVVIERLRRIGLVDDDRFAEEWIDNRNEFRPRSKRALAYELRRKGISNQIIDRALDAASLDEDALAYQAAQKQYRKYKGLEWQEFRGKLGGYLARRGFSYQIIAPVVERVWEELERD